MPPKYWTHCYRYRMELPYPYPRLGNIVTGTVQVEREYTGAEIEALAKTMAHGIFDSAKLIDVVLIETRIDRG